jgi:pimeloyl-ACP methyl ester carboxylesterase
MPYLTVRDIDIFFDRASAGAPLLAISGSRGDLRRKPNLLESPRAKSFDVLAYDQRELGRTSKPSKAYSISDYADDAAALLDGFVRVTPGRVRTPQHAQTRAAVRLRGRATRPTRRLVFVCKLGG